MGVNDELCVSLKSGQFYSQPHKYALLSDGEA